MWLANMTSLVLSTEEMFNLVPAGQNLSHSTWPPRHVSSKAISLTKGGSDKGRNHYKTRMPRSHRSTFCWFVFQRKLANSLYNYFRNFGSCHAPHEQLHGEGVCL